MTNLSPVSGPADVASGSPEVLDDLEPDSDFGLVSLQEKYPPSAESWPLESHLALGAMKSAVPSARLHARLVVMEWGLSEIARTIELVVSELVTNAVAASEGLAVGRHNGRSGLRNSSVGLWLRSDKEKVLVQVWDGNQLKPHRQEPGLEAEGGRGLLLVEAFCADWGTYVPNGWAGKVVWALAESKPLQSD